MKQPIYLDNNATTQVDQLVLEEMLPCFTQFYGNAASVQHAYGWAAEDKVDLARETVAQLIGCETQEIIFTSGATESDNLALKGVYEAYATKGNHIITAETEHKAVLDSCAHIEKMGGRVTYLPVDQEGFISLSELEKAISPETILIAIMYANNETGVLQDISAIGALAHQHNVLFFCDATQAVGKIPVNVRTDNIDLLAFSGHKIYGPKGVGVLYARRRNPRVALTEQMNGGQHERGRRSGTLNVPGIVGLGKACALCMQNLQEEMLRLTDLRDYLERELFRQIPDLVLNGNVKKRLPQVLNISFQTPNSNQLLSAFKSDIAVSAGSACTSALNEPSYVLKAMGKSDLIANSAIRFGLGRFTTKEEIDYAVTFIVAKVTELRRFEV